MIDLCLFSKGYCFFDWLVGFMFVNLKEKIYKIVVVFWWYVS